MKCNEADVLPLSNGCLSVGEGKVNAEGELMGAGGAIITAGLRLAEEAERDKVHEFTCQQGNCKNSTYCTGASVLESTIHRTQPITGSRPEGRVTEFP